MSDYTEQFQCNECGEVWIWTGDNICPFCKSDNVGPSAEDETEE